uniref:p29 n=1 Tax=Hyalomma asiaticum asiaticum TaxID=266039 RepID=Q5RLZ3_HYAAS|nr:P29 [Hyalomma asiaticum asiaticum]
MRAFVVLMISAICNHTPCRAFGIPWDCREVPECSSSERLTTCDATSERKEQLCPKTQDKPCTKSQYYCKCKDGLRRLDDRQCVQYKDCVTRSFDILQFLQDRMTIYFVGLTNGFYNGPPFVCMKSTYTFTIDGGKAVHRDLMYYQDTNPDERWVRRTFPLILSLDPTKEHFLQVAPYGPEPQDIKLRGSFEGVHGNRKCLILGGKSRESYKCPMWAKEDAFGPLSEECKFIFEQHCNSPNITVRELDGDCTGPF